MEQDSTILKTIQPGDPDEIVAVHRGNRQVLTRDGRTHPITMFLDYDGEETEDVAEAVIAIGPIDDGWFGIDMRDFDVSVTVQ